MTSKKYKSEFGLVIPIRLDIVKMFNWFEPQVILDFNENMYHILG